jgi:peptide/nickel transport system substrate-binding protein
MRLPRKMVRFAPMAMVALLAACGPGAPAQPAGSAPGAQPQAQTPKVLTIGLQRELTGFAEFESGGGGIAAPDIAHDVLVRRTHNGDILPGLAVAKPSPADGTWTINPDGTMDVTWKIHPNVKWHDGTPFTSADLGFTYTVYSDKELPTSVGSALAQIRSAATPDPQTFVLTYARTDVRADQAIGLKPLPKHLLESVYLANKADVPASPYLINEFVGLGPYRLVRWDSGVQIEFTRFDDYYRGRPPLDRITLRYIRDPNSLIANVLSGAVDVVIPPGPDVDAGVEVQQRWQGTGNTVVIEPTDEFGWIQLQMRPEVLQAPRAWLNRDVRAALYHAVDRQTLTQTLTHGLSPTADSWIPPDHPLRSQLQDAIPQYPYDPTRSNQLLAQAGWTRGPDGILVESASGERFVTDFWANERLDLQRSQAITAEGWKNLGVQLALPVVSAALSADRRNEVLLSGPRVGSVRTDRFLFDGQLATKEIASEANRWGGRNRGGYGNPEADAIFDRLGTTIDIRERIPMYRDMLRLWMGDVPIMPLYWDIEPVFHLASVKGPIHGGEQATWNIFEWSKD